ncbi:dCTP deaminase [bacterium (Candidatus Torokbacteria) CG_4_10_14_0_2_um_filter_35_8]|uniref:dCTP deaminase n=1 Tax=Candidatus Sherwoodlollariibacterium unditelluris TaxID=1974757 RepID=A0A2G9YIU8_9BACT|nr:MAG: dCTP deaminase [Candidatus Omnitrophica bacterium CG23_combo_of_CG06-09_8_20_14_all_41_10]PIZ55878.1 MAG: dCTP deaminase [bacterium (Candidatus Torokbacteria) CG_4_10_14_0_2_um_filter_35_8]
MFLSDIDIKKAVENRDIIIRDFDVKRLQPASYDILLGNEFIITDSCFTHTIDPARKIMAKTRKIIVQDNEMFVLHPRISILGSSWDFFGSNKYLIQISGKSSLARAGLIVHNTAGIVNPGHFLNITLELCNLNCVPIILRPKMEIAQLLFSQLSSFPERLYEKNGKYNYKNNKNKGTVQAVF